MTALLYPKNRVLLLVVVKYDTGEPIHLFVSMKLKTITWCTVLTALAATILSTPAATLHEGDAAP
ncbi:MAG: hypothetical protein JWM68_2854, partial [Verrucomicrobiales bacterium]|nr:hypothetical protein [Verrucomicrobiales bacterium]